MVDKYSTRHNKKFLKYLKNRIECTVKSLSNIYIKPIDTDIESFFIVGCGHSGTTLLAGKLGNHPSGYLITRETNAFKLNHGLYSSSKVVEEWLYMTEYLQKAFFLEKTPKHIHSIKRIQTILPKSKFIVMTRNPLDNCASLCKRYGDLEHSIQRWLIDNKEAKNLLNNDNILLVKYEELTQNPIATIKQVCEFLDIDFSDDILSKQSTAYNKTSQKKNMKVRAEQVNEPIKQNINTWKKVLSQDEAKHVLKRCRKLALELGYDDKFLDNLMVY